METATCTPSRGQLRLIAESDEASPQSKISAANSLLDLYGASDRNVRLARRTAKRFRQFVGESEITQRRVRWLAEKLAARIERIRERDRTAEEEPAIEGSAEDAESITSVTAPTAIGGINLLAPDGPDDFWDTFVGGWTRRELFLRGFALPSTISRSEFLATLAGDPAKMAAHIVQQKLWASSREELDQKFKRDVETIREALIERRLNGTDAGREDLVRQLHALGQPLVTFERPSYDPAQTGLPVLVRTRSGSLLDAISFSEYWPKARKYHQAV